METETPRPPTTRIFEVDLGEEKFEVRARSSSAAKTRIANKLAAERGWTRTMFDRQLMGSRPKE